MIVRLWKQSLSCITAVLGRAFHPWSFKNGGETVWQHNFQQLHTDTNDSVMHFYFFLSAILIILHWKIASTSLIYFFHSTPNRRCFVLVHFQSHNVPNLPPLHISETGYGTNGTVWKVDVHPPWNEYTSLQMSWLMNRCSWEGLLCFFILIFCGGAKDWKLMVS